MIGVSIEYKLRNGIEREAKVSSGRIVFPSLLMRQLGLVLLSDDTSTLIGLIYPTVFETSPALAKLRPHLRNFAAKFRLYRMAKYGRRSFKRRRYGSKYGKKRGGLKTSYRKMGRSRSKLYRTGGNIVGSGARPELKSLDLMPWNITSTSATGGEFPANVAAHPIVANYLTAIGGSLAATGVGVLSFGYSNSTTPPVVLNACGTGNDINNRIGRMITMRSVLIEMDILPPTALATTTTAVTSTVTSINGYSTVRLLLVLDRQPNALVASKHSILASIGNSGNDGSTACSVSSAINLANRDRFLILCDKRYHLDTVNSKVQHVRIFKKLNIKTTFNSVTPTTGSYAQISTNMLLLVPVSDCLANSTLTGSATYTSASPISLFCNSRVRFTDA